MMNSAESATALAAASSASITTRSTHSGSPKRTPVLHVAVSKHDMSTSGGSARDARDDEAEGSAESPESTATLKAEATDACSSPERRMLRGPVTTGDLSRTWLGGITVQVEQSSGHVFGLVTTRTSRHRYEISQLRFRSRTLVSMAAEVFLFCVIGGKTNVRAPEKQKSGKLLKQLQTIKTPKPH